MNKKTVARNKRAKYDYEISKTFIAGLVLKGYEVKSAKAGQVSFQDSFVRVERGEAWLLNMHISLWKFARVPEYDPRVRRKLLLMRREIRELEIASEAKGMSIVPLELFIAKGKLKLKIGIGKGRKKYDKRAKLREKEMKRQVRDDLVRKVRF